MAALLMVPVLYVAASNILRGYYDVAGTELIFLRLALPSGVGSALLAAGAFRAFGREWKVLQLVSATVFLIAATATIYVLKVGLFTFDVFPQ